MKVAVVGNGHVGLATLESLMTMREITEIALVGRNIPKIEAEVNDYRDYLALRPDYKCKLYGGGYQLTEDADIIVYTAGAPRKEGQSRLDLLNANVEVAEGIFEEIDKYNKEAIVIVVSNPVDIITTVIQKATGRAPERVIGTGTLLDSGRLRRILAEILDVSVNSVIFNVVGEHGDSSCILWSTVSVAGMSLDDFLELSGDDFITLDREKLHDMMAKAGGKLIKGMGYTAYGVAAAVCCIVSSIVNDSRELITVSTVLNGEYGVEDIAISVPHIVSKDGAEVMKTHMTDSERKDFDNSVRVLKEKFSRMA